MDSEAQQLRRKQEGGSKNLTAMLSCALCSASVEPEELEAHLRAELAYPRLRCLICRVAFFTKQDAQAHFRGRDASHPESEVGLAEVRDWAKEAQMDRLTQASRGHAVGTLSRPRITKFPPATEDPSPTPDLGTSSRARGAGQFLEDGSSLQRALPYQRQVQTSHTSLLDSFAGPWSESGGQSPSELPPGEATDEEAEEDDADVTEEEWQTRQQDHVYDELKEEGEIRTEDTSEGFRSPLDGADEFPGPRSADRTDLKETPSPVTTHGSKLAVQKASQDTSLYTECKLCGAKVSRMGVWSHIVTFHVGVDPFKCKLCQRGFKAKQNLVSHLEKRHGEEFSDRTAETVRLRERVKALKARCFGDLRGLSYKSVTCQGCGEAIRSVDKTSHVLRRHNDEAVFRCRHCPFSTRHHSERAILSHVRVKHSHVPQAEAYDSLREELKPVAKRLVTQLFPKS